MVYERLYGPLGRERDDFHAAQVTAMVAAVNTDEGHQPPTPADFMPDWEEAARGDD